METLIILLLATTAGSLLSLVGGLYLVYGKKGVKQLQRAAVPFAAGALLAAAFLDLLPEAFHINDDAESILRTTLIGIVAFFVLERGLSWFHHHHQHEYQGGSRRNSSLIIFGDTMHNLIDGLAIGAAFVVSPALGVVTTIAVAAHEIPQEIGDFALLLSKGMSKRRVLLVNLLSAAATVIGAVVVYAFAGELPIDESLLLAVTAGFFIYVAASDIIPTIHAEPKRRVANIQTAILIFGIVFVGIASNLAHGLIGGDEAADEQSEIETH